MTTREPGVESRKALTFIAVLVLCALVSFCFFGFLATFEPMEAARARTWRLVYGAVGGLAALATLILVWRLRGHLRGPR